MIAMATVTTVLLALAGICFTIAFIALVLAPWLDAREASARLRAESDRRRRVRELDGDEVAELLYPGNSFRRRQ
jgi:hypothetical protein